MLDQADRALRLAQRVTLLATERGPLTGKAPPMRATNLTDEILEALSEAAVEIANLSSPDNVVCRRLRGLQQKLAPRIVTVGELAQRIDVTPRDVLDAAITAGVPTFWHEGQQFRDGTYLQTYLRMQFHFDPVREVEFNLSPELAGRIAEELGVAPEELLGRRPEAQTKTGAGPRKFVASESRLPEQATSKSREQFG